MLEKNKYVIYLPRLVRIENTVPSVLSRALGLLLPDVLKTTGTIFPYTDLLPAKFLSLDVYTDSKRQHEDTYVVARGIICPL